MKITSNNKTTKKGNKIFFAIYRKSTSGTKRRSDQSAAHPVLTLGLSFCISQTHLFHLKQKTNHVPSSTLKRRELNEKKKKKNTSIRNEKMSRREILSFGSHQIEAVGTPTGTKRRSDLNGGTPITVAGHGSGDIHEYVATYYFWEGTRMSSVQFEA